MKKDRRVLGSVSELVTILWKDIMSEELEKMKQPVDLEELLHPGPSYMCR